jgi:CHAT domain-containing protein/tetratricopeptide (TPR) repeat protein
MSNSPGQAESLARAAHERAVKAGASWRPAVAARYVRSGLLALGWADDDGLPDRADVTDEQRAMAARLLMSLAHYEAEQGNTAHGLRLLDRAEPLTAAADTGVLLLQRGLLFMRTWRDRDALQLFDQAADLLRDYPDPAYFARALLNRSFSHLNTGDVGNARADAAWCLRFSAEKGLDLLAAKAMHNLGFCDLLEGDLPGALRRFSAAAEGYRLTAPSALPVLAMDRARALLAAGLALDAARELDSAIASFRRQRLDQDHADATLARAQAALALGDLAGARRWAVAARRRFDRRANHACAAIAELTALRARATAGGRPAGVAADGLTIATRLHNCGLRTDAALAELVAARALLAAGRIDEARQCIAAVPRAGAAMSLEVGLVRRLALAELAQGEGRTGPALSQIRAGLAMVHARRGRLGSLDLQTGSAALGTELADAGLRLALDRASAPLVFAWLERSRAQAFRVRPVRPPGDPVVAQVLAELRQLMRLIRTAELNGLRDPASTARRAQLQRQIRERAWETGGLGEAAGPATTSDIMAELNQSKQSMISMLVQDGRMLAVVLANDSSRLVGLGDFAVAAEAASRLAADLDTLAGRLLPARLEAVIAESVRHQTEVLTTELIAPLRSWLSDAGVVLVPSGVLANIPWSLLPDLRGRPVTVCPSAAMWLTARRRSKPALAGSGQVVLVAGPDLQNSGQEVTEIARAYPGCRPLLAADATVDATLHALDGAPLAHLAAHGHHDQQNVLFSSLDLADGPLMAYDIQALPAAPRHAVLSACDVGRTVVRPGDEVLGFTAALLYVGTSTVIASVTRVADDVAMGVMTAYHRALATGARPAEALATAAAGAATSSFVCYGAG